MGIGKSSKKVTPATQTAESDTTFETDQICRLALDQSAMLGSLYNAEVDCFLEQHPRHTCQSKIKQSEEMKERLFCKMFKGDELDSENMFDQIYLGGNLRLSVLLNMTARHNLSRLVEHSFRQTECTRFLIYRHVGQEKYLANEKEALKLNYGKTIKNVPATHFVWAVRTGILAVIKFEFFSADDEFIYPVLKKMRDQLVQNNINSNDREKRLLSKIQSVQVYSNITQLQELSQLDEFCKTIVDMRQNASEHRLLDYTLRPIRSSLPAALVENSKYVPLTANAIRQIQQHLNNLSSQVEVLKELFKMDIEPVLKRHLEEQLKDIKEQISKTTKESKQRLEEIRKYVCEIRKGRLKEESMSEMKIHEYETSLTDKVKTIQEQYRRLEEKANFIYNLQLNKIEYWNVKHFVKDNDHHLDTVKKDLATKSSGKYVYCFDDRLENLKSTKWKEFYQKMLDKLQKKPNYEIVYADFTYCECQLTTMDVFISQNLREKASKASSSSMNSTPPTSAPKEKPNRQSNNYINVLLLGESGVGKSTFINALVNYLKFESLREAESQRPVSVMPVSFLVTEGDNFEERVVKFGEPDTNENHNKHGESVTQQCRSYVFTVGSGTKMRLIDTPGMGDTRGLAQDDQNMQQILSFISRLSHLNAICILLKPNESKLNIVLRSYFTRLIGFLGKHVCGNILFCFTNTRSTFFAPGDTAPLLRKMIESHSSEDIRFTKNNTFCFDNQSFRYLIARLNGVKFNDDQRIEYEQSWKASVTESNRFLAYVCGKLGPYLQKDWQSVEHAQFLIRQLARPMLETMRNHSRNLISQQKHQSARFVQLHPIVLSRPSTICLKCKGVLQQFNEFGVLLDDLHMCAEKCENCKCDRDQHMDVDYRLSYQLSSDMKHPSVDEIKDNVEDLQQTIIKFGQFLNNDSAIRQQNDQLSVFLQHMINEEREILKQSDRKNGLNSQLLEMLQKFQKEYASVSNEKRVELMKVYALIEKISAMNEIREQLDVIHQYREKCLAEQETRLK